jgi:hypothetical protein
MDAIILVRYGIVTTPASTDSPPRVIRLAEIYPYHRFRFPDREDFDHYLSNKLLPGPCNRLLEQLLDGIMVHVSIFPQFFIRSTINIKEEKLLRCAQCTPSFS